MIEDLKRGRTPDNKVADEPCLGNTAFKPEHHMPSPRTVQEDKGSTGDSGRKSFSYSLALGALLVGGVFLSLLSGLQRVSLNLSAASRFWFQGDTWWHLAIGKQILLTHTLPRADIFSFTMTGRPWLAYEWLGEVVMAAVWKIGSLRGLMVLLMVLAAVVLVLLFCYSYLRSRNLTSAFIACAFLLPLAAQSFSVRPQMFGYAFLLITLIALEQFRQGHPKILWALPAVFLIWVNAHGTFVLGFAVLAIYLVGGSVSFRWAGLYAERWTPAQRRQLELTILLCLVASMVTPYGTQLAAYPFEMSFFQPVNLKVVTEWQPFPLGSPLGVLLLGLLLLFCVAFLSFRLSCRLQDFILLVLATGLTLLHARFILLFVPVFAPFLAEIIAQWLPERRDQVGRVLVNALLAACIGMAIVWFFPSESRLQTAVKHTVPVNAARFISTRSNLGNMFTYYDWGSYLMFRLGPHHKVFMDGRLDLYESGGVFQNYLAALGTPKSFWTLLKRYNIHSCLIPKRSVQAKLLDSSPQWEEIYHDHMSVVFIKTRKSGGPAGEPSALSWMPGARRYFV